MNKQYTYYDLCESLKSRELSILTSEDQYINSKQDIHVTNGTYMAVVKAYNYINTNGKKEPSWFNVHNPYIIDNINTYLRSNLSDNFTCISTYDECVSRETPLKIRCNRCGEIINRSVHNMRKSGVSRNIITCPNCDDRLESTHAIVLKQIFKHFYADTIEEDPSCINPNTGHTMPTDIVNHRLKIAIEIQGQYHTRESQKNRDAIKKQFWLDKGYNFYDYPIDNVSVLQYVQYFFPQIQEIPDWVKMDYRKKLNLKHIQNLLCEGMKVRDIAELLSINKHRIYDAIHTGNLYYPDGYIKGNKRPVLQFDLNNNYISEYDSYADAESRNNITPGTIASCVYNGSYFAFGYYWIPKDVYDKNL